MASTTYRKQPGKATVIFTLTIDSTETEIASSPLTEKDFPFAESLLRLLDLNIWEYEPLMKDMEQALLHFYRTKEPQDAEIILTGLDQLAAVHIYFELLRLERRFAWIKAGKISAAELYAWGEKARAKKVECDDGSISLEEYQDWLKNS